jgi:hypothetical protein
MNQSFAKKTGMAMLLLFSITFKSEAQNKLKLWYD